MTADQREALAPRPAHRDLNVLRWLVAHTLSVLGSSVYFLSLGWAAQDVATPAQVGMVMAAGSLPRAVLMLGGGVVADRYGPRRVVIGSDAVRCVLILGVAVALAFGNPGLWLLVAVALVFGAVDALFMPAVGALPPRLTTGDQLARLQGLRVLTIRLGQTVGPPTAGLALGLGGTAVAFGLAGCLFVVSLILLWGLRLDPLPAPRAEAGENPPSRGAWAELAEGLRYVRHHRLLGPLVLIVTLTDLAMSGPLNVGIVLLASDRGWGAAGAGWLVAGFGGGATAGAALLAIRGWLPRAGRLLAALLAVAVGGCAGIGLAPTLPLAVTAAAFSGLGGGLSGAMGFALLQNATAPGYLGRVTSVATMGSLGIAPLAYPVVGTAIGAFGVTPVYLGCAVFGLSGVVVALSAPAVRHAELPRLQL